MDKLTIAIIEDDVEYAETLEDFLSFKGYETFIATSEHHLTTICEVADVDLFIVDVNLGNVNGLDLAARLYKEHSAAIIVLTSSNSSTVHKDSLELGADSFLNKSSSLTIIEATIRSVLRRTKSLNTQPEVWSLLPNKAVLKAPGGVSISLNKSEFAITEKLLEKPSEVVDRKALVEALGKEDTLHNRRYLDVIIQRFKKKITDTSQCTFPIKVIYGKGYVFLP
jgi:DNA-binding response OmpR family regulator